MRSLFIFNPADLDANPPGGVQICSLEFLNYLQKASDSVSLFPVQMRHTVAARVLRRVGGSPYRSYVPEDYREKLSATLTAERISHVFINKAELVRFASLFTGMRPHVRTILMSHGNQTGDDLYDVAADSRHAGLRKIKDSISLGLHLVTESEHRHALLDAVCVMSREEETLEHWLGARKTFFLPRALRSDPIEWRPVVGRVGYTGTLNHPPNCRALELVFEEIQKRSPKDFEVRLVGKPESQGSHFAGGYPFVRYLKALDEKALREEMASWCACLNPIFWLARGASMKLATALKFGLPVVSTKLGARGYDFGNAGLPLTENNPRDFTEVLFKTISTKETTRAAALRSSEALAAAPSIEEVGGRLREFALSLP